jgi:hypothetical protein
MLLVSLPAAARVAVAQDEGTGGARTISRTFRWRDLLAHGEVRLRLAASGELADDYKADNYKTARVTLRSLPSGEPLVLGPSDSVKLDRGADPQLVIKMRGQLPPDPFDDRVRVTVELPTSNSFSSSLFESTQSQQADAEAREELEANLRTARELREIVRGWVAYSKITSEKHLVISPGVSAPGGGGGSLDLHPVLYKGDVLKMNHPINQIEFGLDMDKASASKADPNFLNAGFSFKKIIPLQRAKALRFVNLSEAVEEKADEAKRGNHLDAKTVNKLNDDLRDALVEAQSFRQHFFRALVITPFSPRLETDLKALKPGPVNNFVNTTEFQFRTGTRALIFSNLLWSLRLVPVALESGVTLRNKDLPLQKGQGILRLNTGIEAKIALNFLCRSDIVANRIQFEFKALNRHLLRDERAFDLITKRNTALVRGNRYTMQAEAKYVFGFVTPIPRFKRRPALTVRYKNGFFPPSYLFNNAVTFHFTLESDDNDNASDIDVK